MIMQADRDATTIYHKTPHVLTVVSFDSGSDVRIQACLKACAAGHIYCSTVITAIIAQNIVGVHGVDIVPDDFVAEQSTSVPSCMHVDVAKTCMLPSINIMKVPCQSLRKIPVKALVVDLVRVSTSGDVLAGLSVRGINFTQ